MVTADVELELRAQLKEAGKLLSNPPDPIDDLLHILDQLGKLLSMVDQSPNNLMQEALSQPTKVLIDERLLEHSNTDVKVSVASCLCEITRITAPEAPYSDEELKRFFQCVVSSFENLSDISDRSYSKRVSILEIICKVRACVIMLDLECDDLIVKLFQQFLNSVRDHHLDNVFLLMANIMALVLEESEDISLDILRPLLASVKNDRKGVLPVARKLGEEVIKKSADKLRPYLNNAVTVLGDSLVDYSQLLTSICEGNTNFVELNDESASVQPKVVDTAPAILSSDDADKVNIYDERTSTEKREDADDENSNKPGGPVKLPGSSLTEKLDKNDTVAEASGNVESSNPDATTKSSEPSVSETVDGENRAEKIPEIVVSVQKPLETKAVNGQTQSSSRQEESQSGVQIKKVILSKKTGSGQTDPKSTVVLITKLPEGASDPEIRSPKRVRKKTAKAEENKPSVTSGSDVEPVKKSTKKPDKVDVDSKKKSLGHDDASLVDVLVKTTESGSGMISPKRVRKKTPKAEGFKPSATSGSDVESLKITTKNAETVDSVSTSVKRPGKKEAGADSVEDKDKPPVTISSAVEPVDSGTKPTKRSGKKAGVGSSAAKKRKLSGKKVSKSKKSKPDDKKDEPVDSDAKTPKPSAKKGKSKQITKHDQDLANKDEETESDNKQLKPSENKEVEETESDHKPHNLSVNEDEEDTDSDNIPLSLAAKRIKKSSASLVKLLKNKDGKKKEGGKTIDEKDQTKSLSEDDGMDVSLKSALKKASKGKSNSKEARSSSSKRKRAVVTKKKGKESIKYDDSLIGQKVKVWWPDDKMFYEGVVKSFDPTNNKHKILYVDGDEELLTLNKEKWEILKEFSTQDKVDAVEVQTTEILPETAGSSKEESKVDLKKEKTEKIVYSRGKKGNKRKAKRSDENAKEAEAGDGGEEPEIEKGKSTETPKIEPESEKKKKKVK